MYDAHDQPICGHPDQPIAARRLCIACYNHHHNKGTLDQFPTSNHKLTDVIEEFQRMQGMTKTSIARAIGITPKTLNTALDRAVRQGLISEKDTGKKGLGR